MQVERHQGWPRHVAGVRERTLGMECVRPAHVLAVVWASACGHPTAWHTQLQPTEAGNVLSAVAFATVVGWRAATAVPVAAAGHDAGCDYLGSQLCEEVIGMMQAAVPGM